MATLLLIIIYIAFIGLGIPDSLFGPAWPAIYKGFGVPVSYASFVSVTVTLGTVVSSLLAARLIQRVGTRWIVVVSTFMTVAGLLGYAISPNLFCMVLCAIPLGLGAGCIDSALNNYVALHYKNFQMNFLHCFYGIGVTLSPYLMSIALAEDTNWRKGYMIAFFIQLGLATLLLVTSPLWNKVKAHKAEEEVIEIIPLKRIITLPMALCAAFVFFCYCGIEVTSGVWSSSFLVEARGFDPSLAARLVTLFYAGMATGRFISGIVSIWVGKRALIISGMALMLTGILLLVFTQQTALAAAALFILGCGCGPVYPNLMSLTPNYYGVAKSQSIVGFEMALAYTGCLSLPPLFGVLGGVIGFQLFPYYLLILYIPFITIFIILMILYSKRNKTLS